MIVRSHDLGHQPHDRPKCNSTPPTCSVRYQQHETAKLHLFLSSIKPITTNWSSSSCQLQRLTNSPPLPLLPQPPPQAPRHPRHLLSPLGRRRLLLPLSHRPPSPTLTPTHKSPPHRSKPLRPRRSFSLHSRQKSRSAMSPKHAAPSSQRWRT